MDQLVNHKLIEKIPESSIPIRNADKEMACSVNVEDTGIFLYIKRANCKDRSKKTVVRICLLDLLKQVWGHIPDSEKKEIKPKLETIISE